MLSIRALGVTAALMIGAVAAMAPSASGDAKPPRCQTGAFKLSKGSASAATSHYRQVVKLKNVSGTSCTVAGWFTVKLLDAKGATIASSEQRITSDYFGSSSKKTVELAAGGRASFAIDTVAPATTCPYSNAIAVTAPGGHGRKLLSIKLLACAHFAVLPVQPGNHANP